MASRQESAERTRALITDLRARIRRGEFPAGTRIPGLIELGRRHGLSKPTVLTALQPLIADGTLQVRTRIGVYVADPHRPSGVHVIVTSRDQTQAPIVRTAFAAQLDELGAESLALEAAEFCEQVAIGGLPTVLSVFVFAHERVRDVIAVVDADVPVVQYAQVDSLDHNQTRMSYVDLDNADAGRRAARELLFSGHRDIAFLGMHADDHPLFAWSSRRADGCAETVHRHQPRSPMLQVTSSGRADVARRYDRATSMAVRAQVSAQAADRRREFSACVGADDRMIAALSNELHAQGVPETEWPVMVGIEGLTTGVATHVASVVPGWAALGARAGQLLFDSVTGHRIRPGLIELIPAAGVATTAAGVLTAK